MKEKKSIRDFGIIQKKNKTTGKLEWYARIVRLDGNGKRKEYTAKAESKSEARRLRDELSHNFEKRGEKSIEGNKLTFRELAKIYSEKKLVKAVYHGEGKAKRKVGGVRSLQGSLHYLNVLKEYFGAKLIRNITHNNIEEFKSKRLKTITNRGERSIADVNRTLELMRGILRFAVREGWLTHSSFEMGSPLISKADEVKRERTLTIEEEKRLLEVCDGKRTITYSRNGKIVTAQIEGGRELLKALIITAIDTAMRKGELIKLQWEDVSFATRTITITAFNSKTTKARNVGMTQRVFDELSKLWENSPKEQSELVFGIKDNFKKSFASACRDAEITGFRFHDLRHTAITRMISLGIAPMEIMKISGHTQMITFSRYVNPDTNAVQNIAERLSAYQAESIMKAGTSKHLNNYAKNSNEKEN